MGMIDLGIGTQIIPTEDLANTLGMSTRSLEALCRAGKLNLIKKDGRWWVGLWQFRLLMTAMIGFHGETWDLDADPPETYRMNEQGLKEALGHLCLARSAHKGTILQDIPPMLERAAKRWNWALSGSPKALVEQVDAAIEKEGLRGATEYAFSKQPCDSPQG
jgi:hypothetical protein